METWPKKNTKWAVENASRSMAGMSELHQQQWGYEHRLANSQCRSSKRFSVGPGRKRSVEKGQICTSTGTESVVQMSCMDIAQVRMEQVYGAARKQLRQVYLWNSVVAKTLLYPPINTSPFSSDTPPCFDNHVTFCPSVIYLSVHQKRACYTQESMTQ